MKLYLFQRINEADFKPTDARHAIGTYLLEHREQIQSLSMEKLAQLTHTSKTSLVRFAQYFGFSGWKEFLYAFTHEVATLDASKFNEIDVNFPFSPEANKLEIIEKIASLRMRSLEETVALMSAEAIDQAAIIINDAQTIVIYGTSPNSYYGELFKRNLLTIHKKAFSVSHGEAGLAAQGLDQKDCAVIISYSGNNPEREPISNLAILQEKKVPTIAITSGEDNYLRKHSQVALTIPNREKLASKVTNFATEEATLLLLNVLFGKVFALNYEQNQKKMNANRNIPAPLRNVKDDLQ